MASIVTDLVTRLIATHRLIKMRVGVAKPVDNAPEMMLPELPRRRPTTPHKPVEDYHLRTSHLGG